MKYYLDIAEVASEFLAFTPVGMDELLTNVLTLGAKRVSGVDVNAMETGLQAINDTADLDWAVDRGLFQHKFAANIGVALDLNKGTTRAFDGLGITSDSKN